MSSILIKNVPVDLHRRLKEQAVQHHRSLNKEVIALLETALMGRGEGELPPPVKLKKPLSRDVLEAGRRGGRA